MFTLKWTTRADSDYAKLKSAAEKAFKTRKKSKKRKSSKQEGLFKQIRKILKYLKTNPKHPSLNTHEYESLAHPWDESEKVWEAYAQNNTPSAYRIFWCYGPKKKEITIITITPHP